MEIIITARHTEMSEAMKEHARQRIEKFPRFFDRIQKVNVTLTEERNKYTVELIAEVPGNDIIVSETADEIRAALDLVTPKMERQLKKLKEKLREHPRGKKPLMEAEEQGVEE